MEVKQVNKFKAELFDEIIGGDFIDEDSLIQICDDFNYSDDEIAYITKIDLDYIKHYRGENK